ncbi:MAG: maltose alpha-D-glucosyltransferase [Candidatus Tectomicrobia bacterium]|uniref:Maltokinase n=1 Tax=Tectimicrobiota bacterium TaxID=2528274 RepID=A0A932CRF6_UNCTE|nr:maltose alpha-D-glucosyltransferase [Candidatus Tectomicrobia bacterium]
MANKETYREEDPLWYKDVIIYELHVKAFCDSNADGIGDFRGLTKSLDYLEDLGITAVWLLPFYPSPLKDDGYDIADYFTLHPDYGTLQDFRDFLREAHQRGIRVITELVVNHTSDQHPWFQLARQPGTNPARKGFYVWSDTPERYRDARIIFKDFETSNWTWDPVAKAYYWHRFYSHQPDLNYESLHVQRAIFRVLDFWLGMGVDGLRLDAVPYLYEREGTNCENLPEAHQFLKKLRAHVESKFQGRMLLAEANQWPEDAIAYFGEGDECHMAFHFPLMPRMFMALQMEDRFPIIDILDQTPPIPESCQWALFLRNHDELTLEMVTDEERDYMYRVYARDTQARINLGIRRRLSPLLANERRKIELMKALLFYLPGTPILYYGDEIGMGDNYYLGDRNGVRTPMQWSPDRNAGFSKANPQQLYLPVILDPEYHYEAVNVENQRRNPSSLFWWMKSLIAMRKRFKVFGRGDLTFLFPDNRKVLAFTRHYQEERILVVANLSRSSQVAELDLSRYAGLIPEDAFSQNRFPPIKESPYMMTLGAYDCFLFLLQPEEEGIHLVSRERGIPMLSLRGDWKDALGNEVKKRLEGTLAGYLRGCRWFGGKARAIRQIRMVDDLLMAKDDAASHLLLLEVSYTEGLPELYLLPLSLACRESALQVTGELPQSVIARLRLGVNGEEEGILYDALYDKTFREGLLGMIARKRRIKGEQSELVAYPGKRLKDLLADQVLPLASQVLKAEQSNSSILYENTLILKLYRRLEEGINPDLEIVRFLSEKARFPHSPPFAGAIEYRRPGLEPILLGHLQGLVPHEGDAWTYGLDVINRYFERVLSLEAGRLEVSGLLPPLLEMDFSQIPPPLQEAIGGFYLEMASLLGQRTGELHRALCSVSDDPDFAPEPFSVLYLRSVYQSMRSLTVGVMQTLGKSLGRLPEGFREEVGEVLSMEKEILNCLRRILGRKISALRIRTHGDYHLGQVLFTGKDFVIIDFEGEPARALSERRIKRSALRDVAGMIRSFHYVIYSALLRHGSVRPEDTPLLEPWAELCFHAVSGIFLHAYLDAVRETPLIPKEREDLEILLQAFLLEKAVYELGYELNNRPDWLHIPIKGIKHLMRQF